MGLGSLWLLLLSKAGDSLGRRASAWGLQAESYAFPTTAGSIGLSSW